MGLSLNVTAVSPTDNSYLTVFPADVVRPLASNLNWVVGASAVPNAVTVGVSVDGRISFFNNAGDVDVVADIVGYYADHTHDDRYYTESEIDTMLAAAVSHDHSHDDRYFTEAEVTAALDAKADAPPSATQVHIDSTEFQPASTAYAVDYLHEVANGRLLSGVHACFVAPLHLPNGALVTSLSVVGSDLNASPTDDFAVILYRNPAGATPGPTIMANVASSLSPGLVTLTDSSVMNAVADNTANSYFLRMCDYPNTYVSDITIAYTNP